MKQRFNSYTTKRNLVAISFIVPCMIGFLFFYLLPTLRGLWYSFTDWDLFNKAKFIGLKNYKDLFHDKDFWTALKVTVYYVLLNIPLQTVLAILIALIMNRSTHNNLLRSIMLTPWIMSNVVVALLWFWMMDSAIGILNVMMHNIGLKGINFLTSTEVALPSIAFINIWRHMGYTGLLVFAGLQSVPKEIEEAAIIDGAGPVRTLFSVVIPYIRPVLAFVIITTVIGSFQIYDTIAVTTKGGPVTATYVLNIFIYKNSFESYKMGYSSAASMVLFLILICVSAIQMKIMRGNESD